MERDASKKMKDTIEIENTTEEPTKNISTPDDT